MEVEADVVRRMIGVPFETWKGNCMMIAQKCMEHGCVPSDAKICYGHYWGPISPHSKFAGRPFSHHAWIELGDGFTIWDPTRWVFENVEPYIFIDDDYSEYDLAGLKTVTVAPVCPRFKGPSILTLDEHQKYVFSKFVPKADKKGVDMAQAHWLVRHYPDWFQGEVATIFQTIIDHGYSAIIPLDLRYYVFGIKYKK